MAEFKKNLLTTGIGALFAVAVGGVKALNNLTIETTVPRYTPAAQGSFDWWWSKIMWSMMPVAVFCLITCIPLGIYLVTVAIKSAYAVKQREPSPKKNAEFEQWRLDKMFGASQQTAKTTAPEKPVVNWLSMADAFTQSSERKWIIGQATEQQPNRETSRQAIGQLLTVDYQTANFAILGGVGGGKTSSTGMMMLMYAKKYGLHTIVLDGKDGLDWGPLGDIDVIEWHSMTPENLGGYIDQLNHIYKERHALMRRNGVGKIYDLPKSIRPQPLFVIMEEFGRTWARTDKDKDIENGFNDLFCLSRAAGIILCPIDQAPEDWSRAMRANAKIAICYPAQGDALKAFGEHYIAELPQTGHFSRGNVFYKAWHTGKLYNARRLPKIQQRYLTTPTVRQNVREHPQNAPVHETNMFTNAFVNTLANTLANTETDNQAKWQNWIRQYAETNSGVLQSPPKGIRALARAMSRYETGTEENDSKYVGIASETCRLLRGEP